MSKRNIKPSTASKVSLTQQQFQRESDINNIVSRYLPKDLPASAGRPKFGDFTGHDFMKMMNSITSVETQFNLLPASIRRKFGNSPLNVVQFVEDPANKAVAIELGLLPDDGSVPKTTPPTPPTPVTGGTTAVQTDLVDAAKVAKAP